MRGWKKYRLDDIADIVMGLSPAGETYNQEVQGLPLLNGPTEFGETYPNCTIYTTDPKRICKKGDLIFCVRGSTTGRMNWADKPYAIGRGVCSITGKDELTTKFIKHLLSFNLPALLQVTGGGTFPNLRKEDINGFEFRIPLHYRKFASILTAYDDLIENNLRRIKLLEELAQRTYEEWFVKFTINGEKLPLSEETGLPEGWERKKLGEVAHINHKSLKNGFSGLIKYVDISSVSTGNIETWIEYDYEDAPGRARRIVEHGDIIWSCVRPNRKSHAIIWNPEERLIVSTGFAVITPHSLPTSFLYQALITDTFVGYLTNMAGGAAYPAVTSNVFEDAEIVIPEKELPILFDNKIKPAIEIISKLKNHNRLLKESRDILLPRLMGGVITIKT